MPQSFACLHYHLVFSTKDRMSLIMPEYRQQLYDYIGGIIRAEKGTLLGANGTADHTHLLATLHREIALSAMLRIIKAESSRWVHQTFPDFSHFAWQAGYGAFTISHMGIPRVLGYLAGQEKHHRTVTFKEEFILFLQQHEIAYDERFLWD